MLFLFLCLFLLLFFFSFFLLCIFNKTPYPYIYIYTRLAASVCCICIHPLQHNIYIHGSRLASVVYVCTNRSSVTRGYCVYMNSSHRVPYFNDSRLLRLLKYYSPIVMTRGYCVYDNSNHVIFSAYLLLYFSINKRFFICNITKFLYNYWFTVIHTRDDVHTYTFHSCY